jgi:RNA polymerase sigma-70 factor, ECF subfamily
VYLSQDPEDAALVDRCLSGDLSAFEVLVRRYQRPLFNVALRMLGNRDDAADTTQNTFVKVYQRLDTFDARHRFFSWVYRILLNECLNVLRSRRSSDAMPPSSPNSVSPSDEYEQAERHRRIEAALLALPADSRAVIVLRHFGELSYEEIGTALDGLPVKTVKSRLHSARRRLAELLLADTVSVRDRR